MTYPIFILSFIPKISKESIEFVNVSPDTYIEMAVDGKGVGMTVGDSVDKTNAVFP